MHLPFFFFPPSPHRLHCRGIAISYSLDDLRLQITHLFPSENVTIMIDLLMDCVEDKNRVSWFILFSMHAMASIYMWLFFFLFVIRFFNSCNYRLHVSSVSFLTFTGERAARWTKLFWTPLSIPGIEILAKYYDRPWFGTVWTLLAMRLLRRIM